MSIKSKALAALLATAALALPLQAADAPTVKSIDVELDMAAVQNPDAAAWWGKLETDLEGAILAHLTNNIADDGAKIAVDIDEVSLLNGYGGMKLADATLKGVVKQTHDSDNSRFNTYDLTVDVKAIAGSLGDGFDAAAADVDTDKVYKTLVETFAANVAKNVK